MTTNTDRVIAMSGASGFVGTQLKRTLQQEGWKVIALSRQDFAGSSDELAQKINGVHAIINLAGAPIIKRWTADYKITLHNSRIGVTAKLIEACKTLPVRPALFISTSAIGFYADKGQHTESDCTKGDTFLAHLTQQWEEEAMRAEKLGIRTVIFRLGVVLGKNGGALEKMLLPFKLGLGGVIGDGSQHFSWIHIQDLIKAYQAVLEDASFTGVFNLTAPHPTTNSGLTRALGRALHRPTFLPVPRFALSLNFGEGATVLTGGQRVLPARLLEKGFNFDITTIEEAVVDCVSP